MKYGRNKTRTTVALKIMFVWVVSIGISCPLGIMGFIDHSNVYNDSACVPTISKFVIFGSVFAFYLPFTIMIVTYVMTTKILCDNQRIMRSIAREHSDKAYQTRKERNGTTGGVGLLSPHMYIQRLHSARGSLETTASMATSVNETMIHSSMPSPTREEQRLIPPIVAEPPDDDKQALCDKAVVSMVTKDDTITTGTKDLDKVSIKSNNSNMIGTFPLALSSCNLSSSQPQLQTSVSPLPSPTLSQHSLLLPQPITNSRTVSRASSYASCLGVANKDPGLSRATSLNSMLSLANSSMCGSMIMSDFEDLELMEKLSQIEQEMDECLMQGQLPGEEARSCASQSQTADVHSAASRTVSLTSSCHDNQSYCNDEAATNGNVTNINAIGDIVSTAQSTSISNMPVSINEEDFDNMTNYDSETIPLAKVASPPVTSSNDTLEGSDSENTELVTIHLKASGCYLYKLSDKTKTGILLRKRHERLKTDSPTHRYNFVKHPPKQDSSDFSLDEDATSMSMSTSCSTRRYPTHKAKVNSRSLGFGSGWKALIKRNKKKKFKAKQFIKLNGNELPPSVIPKRTASNEKKASKVLGIIFAVFVVLWTPFFIVNILSVVCQPCMEAMTPTLMAAIVWFGYLSSLANPIIYTMFNTSFRRAFYKILKCQYPMRRLGYSAAQTPDTIGMTNLSNYPSDSRRQTLTLTLK